MYSLLAKRENPFIASLDITDEDFFKSIMQTSKVVVESGLSVLCTEIATDEIVAV